MSNHPNRSNAPAFRAAELAAILARHYPDAPPHLVAEVVGDMQRATRAAVRFATDQCNRDLGDPDDARSEYARRRKREDRAQARINSVLLLPSLNPARSQPMCGAPATVELGGDPRGPCGRLHVPGQRGDGWGDGFAIY